MEGGTNCSAPPLSPPVPGRRRIRAQMRGRSRYYVCLCVIRPLSYENTRTFNACCSSVRSAGSTLWDGPCRQLEGGWCFAG